MGSKMEKISESGASLGMLTPPDPSHAVSEDLHGIVYEF